MASNYAGLSTDDSDALDSLDSSGQKFTASVGADGKLSTTIKPSSDAYKKYDWQGAFAAGLTSTEILDALDKANALGGYRLKDARKAGLDDDQIAEALQPKAAPIKPDQGDFLRGGKEAFQQLPQLGYGLAAGAAAGAETAFGEGGLATSMKQWALKGYKEWGDKIESQAKESDSFTYSWDEAKKGNIGALTDWIQHGLGYAGGQAVQMLATAGLGGLVGKATLGTAAKTLAEGMVSKEAAAIAASDAAKGLTAEQIGKIATANVATRIGQSAAIGAQAFGMEGGEIFGDLTEKNKGRALTGDELAKAFGATLAAGGLEFVGDKLGFDVLTGKLGLSIKNRVGRGLATGALAAPIEGGTEYLQTGLEEYGKGNEANVLPFNQSEQSQRGAFDAAALGAIGGFGTGGVGGAIHTPTASTVPITGDVKTDIDAIIAAPITPIQPRGSFSSIDELATFAADEKADLANRRNAIALDTANKQKELADLAKSEQSDLAYLRRDAALEAQKQRDFAPALEQVRDQTIDQANALTRVSGVDSGEPTAMQLAMERARKSKPAEVTQASKVEPAPLTAQEAPNAPAMAQNPANDTRDFKLPVGGSMWAANVPKSGTTVPNSRTQNRVQSADGQPSSAATADNAPRVRPNGVDAVASGTGQQASGNNQGQAVSGGMQASGPSADAGRVAGNKPADAGNGVGNAQSAVPSERRTTPRYNPEVTKAFNRARELLEAAKTDADYEVAYKAMNDAEDLRLGIEKPAPKFKDFTTGNNGEVKQFDSKSAAARYQLKNKVRGYTPREQDGRWVLSKPLKERSAAQKANDAKLKAKRIPIDVIHDDMLEALRKGGGINMQDALDNGMDRKDIKAANKGGFRKIFKKGGMSMDAAREYLAQGEENAGYLDPALKDDLAHFIERLTDSVQGQATYRAFAGQDYHARLSAEAQALSDQKSGMALTEDALAEDEFDQLAKESQGRVQSAWDSFKDEAGADIHGQAAIDELNAAEQESIDAIAKREADNEEAAQDRERSAAKVSENTGEVQRPEPAGKSSRPEGDAKDAGSGAVTSKENVAPVNTSQERVAETGKSEQAAPVETQAETPVEIASSPESNVPANPLIAAADRMTAAAERMASAAESFLQNQSPSDLAAKKAQDESKAAEEKRIADLERTQPLTLQNEDKRAEGDEARKKAAQGNISLQPSGKIQDFGEKIGGARKDYAAEYKDSLRDAGDLESEPFSKAWPLPDYQKLLDAGTDSWAVAFARAARDEVPPKPRSRWKLSRWTTQARVLRDFTNAVMSGEMSQDAVRAALADQSWAQHIRGRIDLYDAVGHAHSLDGIRLVGHTYSLYGGKTYDPPKLIWTIEKDAKATAFGNWPKTFVSAETREGAIQAFKEKVAAGDLETKAPEKQTEFVIYSKRGEAGVYVGKKLGKNYIDLKKFDSSKDAREYAKNNFAELEAALEKAKYIPPERNEMNSPRVGADHRNGANVTPEQFTDAFGFRGVQFGNYVENQKRQADLNQAYDALMDMAGVLGIPSRALSLNGQLALAFGARGKGGKQAHAAHYERGKVVINLTKERGAGSLAHEWFHAVDNYFSRMRGQPNDYLTEQPYAQKDQSVRPEMIEAFRQVMTAIRSTDLKRRSKILDGSRSSDYWSTGLEMAARAYESYIVAKLQDQGASNDYLANIVSPEYWEAAAKLGLNKEGGYPYPTAAEAPVIRAAFDQFFNTIQTKETDTGTALYSRGGIWKSQMLDAIGTLMANQEPAKQLALKVEAWAKAGKFKQDELTWSGLSDWLKTQEGKVTKQQVQDFIRENGVQVEEVVLGENDEKPDFSQYTREELGQLYEDEVGHNPLEENPDMTRATLERDLLDIYADPDSAEPGQTKFSQYQLPGGEDYREIVLTIPNDNYESPHFPGIKGYIAHVRVNTRYDAKGEKTLHIEESQSDRGQKGRKDGFAEKQTITVEAPKYEGEAWDVLANGTIIGYVTADSQQEAQEKADRRFGDSAMAQGVPRAPFVQNTSAWTALVLKRIIKYAIDNGFQKISWTNGEQQAARYDLSKQVDSIKVEAVDVAEPLHFVDIKMAGGKAINLEVENGTVREGEFSGKSLDEIIGKDMADKVLAVPQGEFKTFSGLDLKVGGEGMRGFYDSLLPNVANDLLRKLSVGSHTLSGKPVSPQVIGDGSLVNAKAIRNLALSKTFVNEGFYGLSTSEREAVQAHMLAAGKDRQVLDAIIKFIPVDMVNVLRAQKLTPEMLFHNPAMLIDKGAIKLAGAVPAWGDVASASVSAAARGAAEVMAARVNSPVIAANKSDATLRTIQDSHNGTPTSNVGLEAGGASTSSASPIIANRVQEINIPGLGLQPGFSITPAMRESAQGGLPLFARNQKGTISPNEFQTNEENRQYTDQLERALQKGGGTFRATPVLPQYASDETGGRGNNGRPIQKDNFRLAEKVAGVFGKQVVWVRADGDFGINGVIVGSIKDKIFIDVRTKVPAHAVMGHEMSHWIEKDSPEIYSRLMRALDKVLIRHEEYRAKYNIPAEETKADISKEIVGDLMGDAFADPQFWSQVAKENPGLIRGIANKIMQWLNNAIAKFNKAAGFGSDAYVNDLKVARHALAKAVAEYALLKKGATQSDATGEYSKAYSDPGDPQFHRAFHGTPHDFDQFSLDKIGTGEGAQAYGHGLYFAGKREVAEYYKNALGGAAKLVTMRAGKPYKVDSAKAIDRIRKRAGDDVANEVDELVRMVATGETTLQQAKREAFGMASRSDWAHEAHMLLRDVNSVESTGKLYEVELAPKESEYLDWDKPLSEQSEGVRAALALIIKKIAKSDAVPERVAAWYEGRKIYQWLAKDMAKPQADNGWTSVASTVNDMAYNGEAASNYLKSIGIPGIRYLDGSSRSKGEGHHNYVLFDAKDVTITAKYSRADQVSSPAFKRWFGNSRVVDSEGNPLVVYHGTAIEKDSFRRDRGNDMAGIYFATNPEVASDYAEMDGSIDDEPPHVIPAFLSIKNPKVLTGKDSHVFTPQQRDAWESEGFDGAVNKGNGEWIAFRPEQIKSAIGNRGTFGSAPNSFDGASDTFSAEHLADGLSSNASFVRNFTNTRTFQEFGLGGFDIPSRNLVGERVIAVIQDLQVRDSIVGLFPVDMVNILRAQQLTPKMLLNDVAMLKNLFAINSDKSVPFSRDVAGKAADLITRGVAVNVLGARHEGANAGNGGATSLAGRGDGSALVNGVAAVGTKGSAARLDAGRRALENGSALDAGQGRHTGSRSQEYAISYSARSGLSTIENFDSTNPDIRYSRTAADQSAIFNHLRSASTAKEMTGRIASLLESDNTFNRLTKNINTQFHKAQLDKDFKKVFDAVQSQMSDTEHYAIEAEKLAPDVLIRMQGFSDIGRTILQGGKQYAADMKAIAQPLFANIEGKKGVKQFKYTDAELKSEWKLTEKQIKLYHQYQAATAQSIDRLAQAKMLETAISLGMDVSGMKNLSLEDTHALLRDAIFQAAEDKRNAAILLKSDAKSVAAQLASLKEKSQKAINDADEKRRNAKPDELKALMQTEMADPVIAEYENLRKYDERVRAKSQAAQEAYTQLMTTRENLDTMRMNAKSLIDRGYTPAMRFGDFEVRGEVSVQDEKTGKAKWETKYMGRFESQAQANAMKIALQKEHPEWKVTKGKVNPNAYKMLKGVSPESFELMAQITGNADEDGVKQYIALAKSSRAAEKRLLERQGIAGFSEDASRVLAAFVTSNARATAQALNSTAINEALASKTLAAKGDVQAEAQNLVEYVSNPNEEASKLRGLLFMHYMGGSIASGLVNLTQPILQTAPHITKYVTGLQAFTIMKNAAKAVATNKIPEKYKSLYQKAIDDGITEPHEIHQLMADAGGSTLGRSLRARAFVKAWGGFFSLSEAFNRKVTFLAAIQAAEQMGPAKLKEAGFKSAYEFAQNVIIETQGLYCVDTETECLTVDGWKRFDQLKAGEMVYAVDDNGALVESRLQAVHQFEGQHEAVEFTANGVRRMVVTDNHTNLIQCYSSRDKKWQSIRRVKTADLKGHQHLLRVPLSSALQREAVYTDDEVRLFAWVASEGCLFAHRGSVEKRGVSLTQSWSHNPMYVEEIDDLLLRLGGHFNRKTSSPSRKDLMVVWRLRKPLWTKIHEALPGKMITPQFVAKLTTAQMAIFLEVFTKGDGHFPKQGGELITQKDVGNLDCLQAMAVLSGRTSTVYHRMGDHDFGALYVAKNSVRACVKEMEKRTITVDTVWCPETEHGTWIARCNGRTFVTGNSKANRPNMARGAIGATLFTFKQFSISYVEWLSRLPRKQQLVALALLVLASGLEGLPFAEDIEDLIDTLGHRLGYATNSRKSLRNAIASAIGQEAAEYVLHGSSRLTALDLSGRLGMGNLIPGTAFFDPANKNKGKEILDVLGAAGGLAKGVAGALDGDIAGTLPTALKNITKAYQMADTGEYKDSKGRLVMKTDAWDAIVKSIGFQPTNVAEASKRTTDAMNDLEIIRYAKSDIADKWAQGIIEKKPELVAEARKELTRWNLANPGMRVSIKPADIESRVKEARLTRDQRILKSAPAGAKQAVMADLAH